MKGCKCSSLVTPKASYYPKADYTLQILGEQSTTESNLTTLKE